MSEGTVRVGVVGAGIMGAEIAMIFAKAGHAVLLADQSAAALEAAKSRLEALYDKGVSRGFYDALDKESLFDRLATTVGLDHFSDRDYVTEAVFEREDVKAQVLGELDRICPSSCVLATNTSTIPITILASYLSPARQPLFIGTHYFSPASRMKLVEIIPGLRTSSETLAKAMSLCDSVEKTPVRVKDVPGFAINRLLHVFMIEAVRLVEEGVATPEDIDTACRLGLGHAMGPFELMDATTSNLCLEAQEIMHEAYGERFRPRPLLKQRVRAGLVGGRGRPGWRTGAS
jgi:3-hydroxybutyryl-CoA dehydrogenase